MRVYATDRFEVELPPEHRFPMGKYRALRERLVGDGVLRADEVFEAEPVSRERLERTHAPAWVAGLLEGTLSRDAIRRLGFPWSEAYATRARASVGGTLQAARAALEDGLAGALAGGTHHAHRDFGSGYCAFNDLVVAARWWLEEAGLERVLVFDVDVHQGDGTATLLADEPRAFTTSLHGERNFPSRKQASDLDVALPDGTGDEAYLEALDRALEESLERARPEAVLVQAGVDPLRQDRLGRLDLTHDGLRERDRRILTALHGAGLPTVLTLGGGYAEPIEATIEAHVGTYAVAKDLERCAFRDPDAFAFVRDLERGLPAVRRELLALGDDAFEESPDSLTTRRDGYDETGWYACALLGEGARPEVRERCPETLRLCEAVPAVVNASFSLLRPGTHLYPHRGRLEGVLRCHLPVVLPKGDLGLRFGAEVRRWEEGRCLVFDDTFEHEAWNRGDGDRVVLLVTFRPQD